MFQICLENAGLDRIGKLNVEKRTIGTPMLWISYEFFNPCHLWNHLNLEGLLVNVHNIDNTGNLKKRILKSHDLRRSIGFDGALILDCGGVKFVKEHRTYDVTRVLSLHDVIRPDIIIGADYPNSPKRSLADNRMRKRKTLGNLRRFVKEVDSKILILPVIHGYTYNEIDKMIQKIMKTKMDFECYGIGSLVPLLFPFNVKKTRKIIDLILYVRKKLPHLFLHVFGMSSVLTMHLAFLLGADSVDSQGWVRCAGYGKIQIPALGQQFVKKDEKRYRFSQWSKQVDWSTYSCDCPICKQENFRELLMSSKRNRAIHNAYVLCSEVKLAREFIKTGEYLDFVQNRLQNTTLYPLVRYIKKRHPF